MLIGQALDGRYLLEAQIGAGGMGTVYRARDLSDQTAVAVKILHQSRSLDDERATREAEVLARLDAPGVVRYLAHGVVGPTRYLVTEWIDGGTLAAHLYDHGVTQAEAVLVARRIAEILAPIHAAGVVHRDIKPSNVLLARGDVREVRLIDFGLAWRAELQRLTQTGTLVGTPGYMSPEQIRGERQIDARVDVFALGCLLYECLTGRPAFIGGDVTAVHAKILLAQPPPAGVGGPLQAVLDSLLAKDAPRRLPDAAAVSAALAAIDVPAGGPRRRRGEHVWEEDQRRVEQIALTTPSGALFWVVLAMTDPDDETDENLLRAAAAAHGATVARLPDGAVVATPPRSGVPVEQASHAARLALALRGALPEAPVVVASGSGDASVPGVVDGIIERGLRILETAALAGLADDAEAGIHVDERTKGLLGPEFVVRGSQLVPP